jgi:hypothetical protein
MALSLYPRPSGEQPDAAVIFSSVAAASSGAVQRMDERTQHTTTTRNEMKNSPLKPGNSVPVSGQYALIGARGGNTGQEITGVKGKTLPPTPKPGQGYKLADRTK